MVLADLEIYLDACLAGMGAFCEGHVNAVDIKGLVAEGLSIVLWEMINIVVALRVWGSMRRKKVRILCDNAAAVMVCKTGRTRDEILGSCYRNLWLICARFHIDLEVIHFSGKNNTIADTLSRLSLGGGNLAVLQALQRDYQWWRVPLGYLDLNADI